MSQDHSEPLIMKYMLVSDGSIQVQIESAQWTLVIFWPQILRLGMVISIPWLKINVWAVLWKIVSWAPPNLLVCHWLQNIICEGSRVQFYGRCHTQRRIGGALPAIPSLGMTTTKILGHIFPWHRSYAQECCEMIAPHKFPFLRSQKDRYGGENSILAPNSSINKEFPEAVFMCGAPR